MKDYKQQLQARILELKEQHREIDSTINELMLETIPDQLRIKRLKKEKLHHKDEIATLEDLFFPDIIA